MNERKKYMNFMAGLQAGEKKIAEISMKDDVVFVTESIRYGWKNKGGTCDRECTCGAWKTHWENFSKRKFNKQLLCSSEGCDDEAKHGAHVFHSSAEDLKEWIVPLCAKCNNSNNKKLFNLKIGTILVNANKGETCE